MNNLQRLHVEQGQSPWIDFIDRQLIDSGKLAERVEMGIRGLTSNPTIFGKAVASGQYDDLIRSEIAAGHDTRRIFEEIEIADVGDAADILRKVYDEADGADGFVSIEVSPGVSNDTAASVAEVSWSNCTNRPRSKKLWSSSPARV